MQPEEFDHEWKMKAIEIAALEQIEQTGTLNTEDLFERARQIWDYGYRYNIDKWESAFRKLRDEPPTENIVTTKPTILEPEFIPAHQEPPTEHTKVCPKCGETIKKAWQKHTYKKNSELCGYDFTQGG